MKRKRQKSISKFCFYYLLVTLATNYEHKHKLYIL